MSVSGAVAGPEVVVVGSVHMDLMAIADRVPLPGESLLGSGFAVHPGGKAGNQAVAAARQGARSAIVARIGDDSFGRQLRSALRHKGVDVSWLQVDEREATGASPVLMGKDGVYASIIVPGAGRALGARELAAAAPILRTCAVLLVQLEIDAETTLAAARLASDGGGRVVLNASPAAPIGMLPPDLWTHVDVLVVNQQEAAALLAQPDGPPGDAIRLARQLRQRLGLSATIVTRGGSGVVLAADGGDVQLHAHAVPVIDAIGAGDAFAGAAAAALARGVALSQAVALGNAAGALAVGKRGSHEAAPTLEETVAFLARHGRSGG